MATSGPQTLKQTLNNEGVIPNSLQHFKAFLREEKDGNDDTDNAKGDCELHLEFVMEVDKLVKSDLKTLAKKYFSPDPKAEYRIALTNNTLREEITKELQNPTDDLPKKISQAKDLVMNDLLGYHTEWVAFLFEKKILEDKSGTTYFNGFDKG